MGVEMIKEAVDAFISAREWGKAKKVASELEPRLESYIDQRYKDFLKNEGKADQLASVDLNSALDMFVEQVLLSTYYGLYSYSCYKLRKMNTTLKEINICLKTLLMNVCIYAGRLGKGLGHCC